MYFLGDEVDACLMPWQEWQIQPVAAVLRAEDIISCISSANITAIREASSVVSQSLRLIQTCTLLPLRGLSGQIKYAAQWVRAPPTRPNETLR